MAPSASRGEEAGRGEAYLEFLAAALALLTSQSHYTCYRHLRMPRRPINRSIFLLLC